MRFGLALALLFALPAQAQFAPGEEALPRIDRAEHATIGGYEVSLRAKYVNDLGEAMSQDLRIEKDGETLWRRTAYHLTLIGSDGAPAGPDAARDLDGDGTPDLLIHSNTGGRRCCDGLTLLSLGPTPRVRFEATDIPGGMSLHDLDGDGQVEISFGDGRFADYWTDKDESPNALLILKPGRGGLAIDLGLTRMFNGLPLKWGKDSQALVCVPFPNHRNGGLVIHDAGDLCIPAAASPSTSGGLPALLQRSLALLYAGKPDDALTLLQANWQLTRGSSLSLFPTASAFLDDAACKLKSAPDGATMLALTALHPPAACLAGKTPYARWLDHEKSPGRAER